MKQGRLIVVFMLVMGVLSLTMTTVTAQQSGAFRVYLTFEDGPTEVYTNEILDILAQYGAHGTFFPNGYQITGHEAILQRIVREGHALGNHLWEEPGFYSGANDEAVIAAYTRAEDAMRAALGDQLPRYDAQVKLFRQPGGAARPLPLEVGAGVITYNWHVDSNDCGYWLDTTVNFDPIVVGNVIGTPMTHGGQRWNIWEHGDGSVITFHDVNRVTGRVLPIILDALTAAGATFEVLPRPQDTLGTMPIALGTPPDLNRPGVSGYTLTGAVNEVARVRAEPTTESAILFSGVPVGTALTVTGRTDGWYQVLHEGQTGWMAVGLLTLNNGSVPSLPRY